jgi:hypothetical protein
MSRFAVKVLDRRPAVADPQVAAPQCRPSTPALTCFAGAPAFGCDTSATNGAQFEPTGTLHADSISPLSD